MLDLLSLTVILPLLGAAGILLLSGVISSVGRKRVYFRLLVGLLPITIVGLASLVVLTGRGDGRIALASLYPSSLAESGVELRWDSTLWPLRLGLSISSGCLLLATGGRREGASHSVPVILALLGSGLASLWSGNPLTTMVSWALYDLMLALGWVASGADRQEAVRVLMVGVGSGVLLWAGVAAQGAGVGSVAWGLLPAGGPGMVIWTIAGLVRIGAYPLHTWVPRRRPSGSAPTAMLLLSPLLGWGLWIRLLLAGDGGLPVARWMTAPALLTLLAGSILAWTENEVRRSRGWISMAGNGTILLATVLSHLRGAEAGALALASAGGMMLGAVGGMLSTAMLFLGRSIHRDEGVDLIGWLWAVPSLIGALSLVGAPLTAGYVGVSSALSGVSKTRALGLLVGGFVGHLLVSASTARWLRSSDPSDGMGGGFLERIAYGASLGGLGVAVVVFGVIPARVIAGEGFSPDLTLRGLLTGVPLAGWLMWGGGVLVGGMVGWLESGFRPRVSLWLDALHDVVLLEWGYGLVAGAVEQGLGMIRMMDAILGGRAAILWSSVFLLIVVLMMVG